MINQARGTYTELPDVGDKVDCGDVLYRVDDKPVLLLCGTVPAYRDLRRATRATTSVSSTRTCTSSATTSPPASRSIPSTTLSPGRRSRRSRSSSTTRASRSTGALALGDAVFLPESVRIAKVTGELGGSAQPGAQVLEATSDTPEVQVDLDPSQQGEVKEGDRAQITLPGNKSVTGKVDRLGTSRPDPGRTEQQRRGRDHPGLHQSRRPSSRHAGSTRPRSRWRSRPREWRTP